MTVHDKDRPGGNGPDAPALDATVLAGLRALQAKGGAGSLDDLVGTFLSTAQVRVQQLRVAVGTDDMATVARLSHSLKGSSGNLAALAMGRLCATLQAAATNGERATVTDLVDRLSVEFDRVAVALRTSLLGLDLDIDGAGPVERPNGPSANGGRPGPASRRDEMAEALGRAGRDGWTTAVVAVDHRRARSFNDPVADPRAVARLDGDDFFVVCQDVDAARAGAFATRLAEAMSSPPDIDQPTVAAVSGSDGDDGMALRLALDDGQLRLVYQPVVSVETGRVAGVEALLRWEHPERGTVPPDEFIPAAEASGLIVPIGAWVLEQACRQAKTWSLSFPDRPPVPVSVNVSARQFDADVVGSVARALDRAGLGPGLLRLELTETTVMRDVAAAVATLHDLKALGVSVSIDDFGTGYSSLAYLRRLPLDELKVDKSFVDGLGQDPEDTAIVAAVVAMAHALDLVVVAEGVETEGQFDALRTLGCEMAQGYYFARPRPAQALQDILAAEAEASWSGHETQRATAAQPAGAYRKQLVVVADDDADVLLLVRLSLTTAGFEVRQAATGREAIALVEEFRPDCVILDLMMPDMDGLEVCRALRTNPATADCTIVVLTATSSPHSKVAAFSADADDYIVKPFSPRDLVGRVRAAINRPHPGLVDSIAGPGPPARPS